MKLAHCRNIRGVVTGAPRFAARKARSLARGAMSDVAGDAAQGPAPKVAHRFYHVPASNTAVGHLILENP